MSTVRLAERERAPYLADRKVVDGEVVGRVEIAPDAPRVTRRIPRDALLDGDVNEGGRLGARRR